MHALPAALFFALAIAMSSAAVAQGTTQGRAQGTAQDTTQSGGDQIDVVDVIFTTIEERLIREYYERSYADWRAHHGKGRIKDKDGLPPGLARKGTLPPGLARQLVERGTLPPGLAKRSLPSDLTPLLPRRPPWQEIVIVDDRVLLIERATNLILDVILVAAAEAGG